MQILSQLFYTAGSILLKGYSSTAQSLVAILRNLAAMKGVKSKAVRWSLVVLAAVLGIVWNNRGLKTCFLVNMLMYSVFNLIILNYVGAAANFVVSVTTAVSLLRGEAGK